MEQMDLKSRDVTRDQVEQLERLFPAAVTETMGEDGTLRKTVDLEALGRLLGQTAARGEERYEFTWVGKRQAAAEAARSTTRTLRPVVEESREWESTKNLYLEGDNLEVLRILQESYLGQIKLIYIDPPYNTGKDFLYPDSFMMDRERYEGGTGYVGEDGKINFARLNSAAEGRYHSDWCSILYARLLLARHLLKEDGVILISIDEYEQGNLRKICDEVFGPSNFVECLVYEKKSAPKGVPPTNMVAGVHEYIYCYAKDHEKFSFVGVERSHDGFSNPDNDPRGDWRNTNLKSTTSNRAYEITDPATGRTYRDTWAFSPEEMERMIAEGRVIFPRKEGGQVRAKEYFDEFPSRYIPIKSSLGLYDAQWNTEMLNELMGGKYFPNPKHLKLMMYIIRAAMEKEGIVLDFFSGSATTAHAVMALNAEDGGSRRFILAQIQEPCGEGTEAYKAGYRTICDIGKDRIRRAGDRIRAEYPDTKADLGFRVFRVDESNRKDVYLRPEEYTQEKLAGMVSNLKEDRTDLDLLYACLLDWGLELSLPHTSERVEGCTVHTVGAGELMACFDETLPAGVVTAMAQARPRRAVFRDSCFASAPEKLNLTETFRALSPHTEVKVI